MSPRVRSLLVLIVGGAAVLLAADRVANTPGLPLPRDFPEYWAAGRVNLRGGNPYHPDELLAEQRRAEPDRERAVMMWNPPPALAAYMPLGALGPRWAALVWSVIQVGAAFGAAALLWGAYAPARRPLAALVAAASVGTWWLSVYGQNTGLIVLGLAGFLHFRRADRPLAAGACAALTALKPHLLVCFGVLLIADAVTRRGAKALAAGVAVVALALAAAFVANPAVIGQFVEAARNPADGAIPLSAWVLPVPSYWLRVWLAPTHFWVQFVPCALAGAAALAYRVWKGAQFDWARALPAAVVVSVLATPYGGWLFDLPVLLVPVVWAAARLARAGRPAFAAFVAGQAAVTVATFAHTGPLEHSWWVAPTVLALCAPAVFVPDPDSRYT